MDVLLRLHAVAEVHCVVAVVLHVVEEEHCVAVEVLHVAAEEHCVPGVVHCVVEAERVVVAVPCAVVQVRYVEPECYVAEQGYCAVERVQHVVAELQYVVPVIWQVLHYPVSEERVYLQE